MIDLIHGDCLEKMKDIPDGSIDAVVTDPPYGLAFMGKHWDKGVPGVEFWQEMIRVLKPGGYLVSFGGTRTYHRMASAIEDAGFEIRDMIEWVYGSGFPKSLNIGKAVDKLQGNERVVMPNPKAKQQTAAKDGIYGDYEATTYIPKGTTEWEGWGTALKPAHEPICMARKPLSEKTVAENVLKYGTGGINIDENRVGHQSEADRLSATPQWKVIRNNFAPGERVEGTETNRPDTSLGRFPANLLHDNSEEVRACFPETKSGNLNANIIKAHNGFEGKSFKMGEKQSMTKNGDSGNASRFFKSIIYTAKASKAGRGDGNNHPTVKPVALVEYLINMVTREGGVVLDPFMGSATTGVACVNLGRGFTGIEFDHKYFTIAENRLRQEVLPLEL